ncbi:hypothetical protein PLICRDRAFT_50407 [Plicaturopsis crispa FD-325 SS-3]|nr:hypothetical protein PLICRDRAFT_50407 [Plicaturopsis crispa FD-325 SS-3]
MSLKYAAICLTALAAYALFLVSRFLIRIVHVRFALRHVPGPRNSSLIWGEEWKLFRSDPGQLYFDWHKAGKVVKYSGAFGSQVLSIIDPRAISYIVGEAAYQFPKPHGVRAWFQALLGEGILWVEGKEAHEKQRRSIAPALSQQSVRGLTPIFYETAAKVATQWSHYIDSSGRDEALIEVTNWAGRFSLDTLGHAAFSYDFGCLAGGQHALAEALDGLTNNENNMSSFYMKALFWLFPSILGIGRKGQMIKRTRNELGSIVMQMWKDGKNSGDANGRSLMSIMLRADNSSGATPAPLIVSQMRTLVSAGYETVSAVIGWVLYELAKNPLLQEELREELSAPGDPSFDELNTSRPLLDAVLKETLRMHPVVLENHHVAAETMVVPLSEPIAGTSCSHLTIPKGTILSIPVNVVQKDPHVWGPDADVFRPDRWLRREKSCIAGRRELFAFSEGPRGCIGKTFAFAEIKALTVTLIRQFAFSSPHDIESFQSFVIRPRVKGQSASSLPLLVRKLNI